MRAEPGAGAAAELVRVATNLKVGALSPVPRPPAADTERTAPMVGRANRRDTAERTGTASER